MGEVQSPPGTSHEAKRAALAQAGIYTVGQFAKMRSSVVKNLATVILYKDLSANVALATLDPSHATAERSVGKISYELVDSVHPYMLTDPKALGRFAIVFVNTLKKTLDA